MFVLIVDLRIDLKRVRIDRIFVRFELFNKSKLVFELGFLILHIMIETVASETPCANCKQEYSSDTDKYSKVVRLRRIRGGTRTPLDVDT